MAIYRVVFLLASGSTGASETYYVQADTAEQLKQRTLELVQARNGLLLQDQARFEGVRISLTGDTHRSILLPAGLQTLPGAGEFFVPPNGAFKGASIVIEQDQARAALQLQFTYQNDKNANRYLAFVPDDVIAKSNGEYRPDGAPGWKVRATSFLTLLGSGPYSIAALAPHSATPPSPQNPIFQAIGIVKRSDTDPTIGIVVADSPSPGYTRGQIVRISGWRFKAGSPKVSMNGRYHIDQVLPNTSAGTITYFLRELNTIDPSLVKVFGSIRSQLRFFYPISLARIVKGLIHKRGGPFLRPRGRRLSRVLLDP